jgi:hypothetical protein
MGALSGLAAFAVVLGLSHAISVMQQLRTRKLLAEEEIIAISILVGTILLGAARWRSMASSPPARWQPLSRWCWHIPAGQAWALQQGWRWA